MAGLNLAWTVGLGLPALAVQTASVALARALRTYSRSRLEAICEASGHPDRADAIAHDDERTERAAESMAVLSGLVLASIAGATASQVEPSGTALAAVATILGVAAIDYIAAGAIGRVFAERFLDRAWPIAGAFRAIAIPLTTLGMVAEWLARKSGGPLAEPPRPTSVEVEIRPDDDHPEEDEPELPESTREMLERVVELSRRDAKELMVPRSAMVTRPASIAPAEAAELFRSTGLSRVPLFGENRDDIIGILYAKDLFPALLDSGAVASPRRLARPAFFVPETKMAGELLEELRARRLQIAIVLDEYGGVAGLITLEDLFEELVGPIDDEHDQPSPADPIRPVDATTYEVEASVPLDDLNDRLNLRLSADGDVSTLGGFAFHALGRLPEPGASFRKEGIEFTVLDVADRSIRRLRLRKVGPP